MGQVPLGLALSAVALSNGNSADWSYQVVVLMPWPGSLRHFLMYTRIAG